MPTVNERCKILLSLDRVYVFEIVLLLVPRLKILRRRGLSYFGIFKKQRGTVQFPRNKPQHPFGRIFSRSARVEKHRARARQQEQRKGARTHQAWFEQEMLNPPSCGLQTISFRNSPEIISEIAEIAEIAQKQNTAADWDPIWLHK